MTTPRTPLPIPTQFSVAPGRAGATAVYLPGRGSATPTTSSIGWRRRRPPTRGRWRAGVAGVHYLALTTGATYDIRVRTVSAAGIAGAWSAMETIVAGPMIEPGARTRRIAGAGGGGEGADGGGIDAGRGSPPRTPGHLRYGVILSSAII